MKASQTTSKKEMRAFLLSGLKAWLRSDRPIVNSENLRIIEQSYDTAQKSRPHARYATIRNIIFHYLEQLKLHNIEDATVLHQHYIDGHYIKEIALQRSEKSEQIKYRLRRGIDQMAHLAFADEAFLVREEQSRLKAQLPRATYRTLFGTDSLHTELLTHLTSEEDTTQVVAVAGIGGIGKTSLIRNLVATLISNGFYRHLVWLHINGDRFTMPDGTPADLSADSLIDRLLIELDPKFPLTGNIHTKHAHLTERLEQMSTLLVIDNLESLTVTEQALDGLQRVGHSLQVLLTTRHYPSSRPGLSRHRLGELSMTASVALLHEHAEQVQLQWSQAEASLVTEVYDAVGGNPFALKLIIGLATDLELPLILRDLKTARLGSIEAMYRNIFEFSWSTLSESARELLMIMPLATERGMSSRLIEINSGLSFHQLGTSISELISKSLLDVNGTTSARTYSIHRLTRSFLGSTVINWDGSLPGA